MARESETDWDPKLKLRLPMGAEAGKLMIRPYPKLISGFLRVAVSEQISGGFELAAGGGTSIPVGIAYRRNVLRNSILLLVPIKQKTSKAHNLALKFSIAAVLALWVAAK